MFWLFVNIEQKMHVMKIKKKKWMTFLYNASRFRKWSCFLKGYQTSLFCRSGKNKT
jgi:hypothetical protein